MIYLQLDFFKHTSGPPGHGRVDPDDHIKQIREFPSGKRLHNYRKSPSGIGKSTINGAFSIAMLNYQRVF